MTRWRCKNFEKWVAEILIKFWKTYESVEAPSLPTGVLTVNFGYLKNSAVCVRTRMVNVNTFSATVKDEISEGWERQA